MTPTNHQTGTPDPTPPIAHGLPQASGRAMAANLLAKSKPQTAIMPHVMDLEVKKVELYNNLVKVSPALIAAIAIPTMLLVMFRSSPSERMVQVAEQQNATLQAMLEAQQQQQQGFQKMMSAATRPSTTIGLINLGTGGSQPVQQQQQPAQQYPANQATYTPVQPSLYDQWEHYWRSVDSATFEASRQECLSGQGEKCSAWLNVAVTR